MRREVNALAIILASLLTGCGKPPAKSPPIFNQLSCQDQQSELRVQGTAKLELIPDVVDLTMRLVIRAQTPKEAVRGLRTKRQELVTALKAVGIAPVALHIGHSDTRPVFKPHPDNHLIDGYRASATLVATLEKFERLAEIMDVAAAAGVSNMSSRYRNTKIIEMKVKVREMAVRAARKKAEQLAKLAGVTLGEVRQVAEVGSGRWFGPLSNENAFMPSPEPDSKIMPGAIPLHLTVEVAYRIATKHKD